MTENDGSSSGGGSRQLSADECVRAGMYWFGRADVAAAEAWWKRALYLDPGNTRAQECLRLIARERGGSSTPIPSTPIPSTPFPSTPIPSSVRSPIPSTPIPSSVRSPIPSPPMPSSARSPIPSPPIPSRVHSPILAPAPIKRPTPTVGPSPSFAAGPNTARAALTSSAAIELPDGGAFAVEPHELITEPGVTPLSPIAPVDIDAAAWALGQATTRREDVSFDPDPPLRRGLHESLVRAHAQTPPGKGLPLSTPWDDGPSRTSAVTIEPADEDDALAESTPLPELEANRFFGRAPTGPTFLAPSPPPKAPPAAADVRPPRRANTPDILFTDPVEIDEGGGDDVALAPKTTEAFLKDARDRFQLHDFAGTLELIEKIPEADPAYKEVQSLALESRNQLLRMLESKLGSLDRVPRVLISSEELIWLNLNHRAGFILSQIDGTVSYDDLIALSGMPRLDTLRILSDLIQEKVIGAD